MNKIYTWGSVLKPTKLRAQQKHTLDTKYCKLCGKPLLFLSGKIKYHKKCGEIVTKQNEAKSRLKRKLRAFNPKLV